VCPKHVEPILESNKLLLLHLVGVLYYFTYIDDARSNKSSRICLVGMATPHLPPWPAQEQLHLYRLKSSFKQEASVSNDAMYCLLMAFVIVVE
jgi:hypothetical protein